MGCWSLIWSSLKPLKLDSTPGHRVHEVWVPGGTPAWYPACGQGCPAHSDTGLDSGTEERQTARVWRDGHGATDSTRHALAWT